MQSCSLQFAAGWGLQFALMVLMCMDIRFWQITEAVASTPGILDCWLPGGKYFMKPAVQSQTEMLSDCCTTHTPVPPADTRRLDLVVPGLNAARGLPYSATSLW
jgi:hypothetical protein